MGAVGTSADNSLAESFNATTGREVLQNHKVFTTMLECTKTSLHLVRALQHPPPPLLVPIPATE